MASKHASKRNIQNGVYQSFHSTGTDNGIECNLESHMELRSLVRSKFAEPGDISGTQVVQRKFCFGGANIQKGAAIIEQWG